MGNVCLTSIRVEDQTFDNSNSTLTNNNKVIKGMVAPVFTDENKYNQKIIEPKVKNLKRQLAL